MATSTNADTTPAPLVCLRSFDYNNVLQGTGYLLAKMDPKNKDQWSRPLRDGMAIWLKSQQNITYTPKVCACPGQAASRMGCSSVR
jgi:hypothetical protein